MNTKQQFQQRVDELVNEWKSDQDKVLIALSVIVDRLNGNDDKGQAFMTIYDADNHCALGAAIDRLIEIELLDDASDQAAQEMEKDMDASRGYLVDDGRQEERDAGHKPEERNSE